MGPVFIIFFVVAVANGLPDYGKLPNEDIVVNVLTGEFISFPATANKEQEAEALNSAHSIKHIIDEALQNIPDPIELTEQNIHLQLSDGISIAASSRGVVVKGQSNLYTETLNINLWNPLRPRITYKVVLKELVIDIHSLSFQINIMGFRICGHLEGEIIIKNSSVHGTATANVLTRSLTDLTTIFNFGSFHSSLVGNINDVNTTNLLATIVTDIIPQILNIFSHRINEAAARIILALF